MIGHVGGAPVEEILLPLLGSGTAMLVFATQTIRHKLRSARRQTQRRR